MRSMFKRLYRVYFLLLGLSYIIIIIAFFILSCNKEFNKINNKLYEFNDKALDYFYEHINFIENHNFYNDGFEKNNLFKNFLIIENNELTYIADDSLDKFNIDNIDDKDFFISKEVIEDEFVIIRKNKNTLFIYVISEKSKYLFSIFNTSINNYSKAKESKFNYDTIFKQNRFLLERNATLSTQKVYLLTEMTHQGIYIAVINKVFEEFLISLLIIIILLILLYILLNRMVKRPFKRFLNEIEILEDNEYIDFSKLNESEIEYTEFYNILKIFKNICFYNINKYENTIQNLKKELVQAKETNKSKLLFLANMSHEMRTPLNSIIGYTQLIKRIGLFNKQKIEEYYERIKNSSELLLQKVNDILDYAKIEQKQFKLYEKPTQFIQIIREVHDLLSIQSERKNISFTYSVDKNIPQYLDIDSTRLKQILINLCSNAIKFTDEGSVNLKVKVFGYTNDAIYLEYTISDTGIGIPQDQIDSIFIPFVQANTPDNSYGGTGLGLAIAKDLIRLMNGDITVTSKENVGTIFTFITKFKISKKPLEKAEDDENISNEKFSEVIKDKQILVCEDNMINQVFIKELFNVFNKQDIDIAKDGIEAVDMCKDKVYDLILMDIQMPNLNGAEATKIIKNMINYKDVPIIALTANAFSDQIKEYLLSGMIDYLAKPIDINNFKKIVVKYLIR